MRRCLWMVFGVLLLSPMTAFSQEVTRSDFTFPDVGDERLGPNPPLVVVAGNGARGGRDLEAFECDRISGNLVVDPNQLADEERCSGTLTVRFNAIAVGTIDVGFGDRDVPFQFDLVEPVVGPSYLIDLQLNANVAGGCGLFQLPNGQSSWTCEDTIVEGENRPPGCEANGPYVCDEGASVQVQASAQDPDGDEVTIRWDLDDDGEYDDFEGAEPVVDCRLFDGPEIRTIFMEASDGQRARTCFAQLTVNNLPPDVAEPFNPIVQVGQNTPYAFCLAATDPSPLDTEHISYELLQGPDGANLDVNTGCILWIPTPEQLGEHQFEVRMSDDDEPPGVSVRAWPVTVVENPDTPSAFAGEDQQIVPCHTEICCQGSDPRGLPLEYQWQQLVGGSTPAEIYIEDPSTPCLELAITRSGTYTFQCTASNGELVSPVDEVEVVVQNQTPSCDAGFDSTCFVGDRCTLDGRRSSDPNGDQLFFQWSQVSPPDEHVRITGRTNPITSFFPLNPGEYCFEVNCRDGEFEGAPDQVCVIAHQRETPPSADQPLGSPSDYLPVSHCGRSPLRGEVGEAIDLDGLRSFDPDGLPLVGYSWQQVGGPQTGQLEGNENAIARFTPVDEGVYTFALRVQDSPPHDEDYAQERWSRACELTVQILAADNHAPFAISGAGVVARQGVIALLDGSPSHDPDGDPITFQWRQLRGPAVELFDATTPTPSFSACTPGIYQFELVVNDGRTSSMPVEVWSTVHSVCNRAPVAKAGPDFVAQSADGVLATADDRVVLDGRQSYDPDEDTLKYQWVQVGGIPVQLELGFSRRPYFEPTLWDIYTFRVFALDTWDDPETDPPDCWEDAWSLPDDVKVVVNSDQNHIPQANAGEDTEWLVGDTVVIDGCNSVDDDGDGLEFKWEQTCGTRIQVDDLRTCAPSFAADTEGEWCFCLRVDDGWAESLSDCSEHRVIINNNEPPRCRAGSGEYWARPGDQFTLDGGGSFDPNADPLFFEWSQVCCDEDACGTNVVLQSVGRDCAETPSPECARATFRVPSLEDSSAEAAERLCFQLRVDDGRADPVGCGVAVNVVPGQTACVEEDPCDCPIGQRPLHCGGSGEGEGEAHCEPGSTSRCVCEGGLLGSQMCDDDGAAYSLCDCTDGGEGEGEGEGGGDGGDDGNGGGGCGCGVAAASSQTPTASFWLLSALLGLCWSRRRRFFA